MPPGISRNGGGVVSSRLPGPAGHSARVKRAVSPSLRRGVQGSFSPALHSLGDLGSAVLRRCLAAAWRAECAGLLGRPDKQAVLQRALPGWKGRVLFCVPAGVACDPSPCGAPSRVSRGRLLLVSPLWLGWQEELGFWFQAAARIEQVKCWGKGGVLWAGWGVGGWLCCGMKTPPRGGNGQAAAPGMWGPLVALWSHCRGCCLCGPCSCGVMPGDEKGGPGRDGGDAIPPLFPARVLPVLP